MWRAVGAVLILSAPPVFADALVATRVIRAGTVLSELDVNLVEAEIPGAATALDQVVGQEVRVTIYPGRPVLTDNIGPPALVQRNQIVPLVYQAGPLAILAEGRALSKGAEGEVIRVMNTTSHVTVSGQVGPDGMVRVANPQE